ncbi:MAG: hypothetical protein U1E80_11330 [Piscinibacter sp.]
MLQAAQRGGEGLQLAAFPFGRAVDQLHRARDLDVGLDARFVHQLERGRRRCDGRPGRAVLRRELALHAFAQRLEEARLVARTLALQRFDDLELALALTRGQGVARVAQQGQRAGHAALDHRRRTGELVVDELQQLGVSAHACGGIGLRRL